MTAPSPSEPTLQLLAAGSGGRQAAYGTNSEGSAWQEHPDAANGQPGGEAAAAAGKRCHEPDDGSGSDDEHQLGSKRARIRGQQQLGAGEAIPQYPPTGGAVQAEAAAGLTAVAAAGLAPAAAGPTLASAVALTPAQQQAVLLNFPTFSPEALAAAQAALPAGPDGQLLPFTLPLIGPGPGGEGLPSLVLDPSVIFSTHVMGLGGEGLTQEQVTSLLASASQMQFIIPLASGQALPAGEVAATARDARSPFKTWWGAQEEQELVSLVEDQEARARTFGTRELDWGRIQAHFGGRSQNACRKKYWQLAKKAGQDSDSDPELVPVDPGKKPRADRKLWEPHETRELLQLVKDPAARARVLGFEGAVAEPEMWDAIARHFECSVQTCKRKHRHADEAQQQGTLVQPGQEKAKRQHHRKQTPYRWMIVNALLALPSSQGTAPDIFDQIEANPDYQPQLDSRIMPGTKRVPRWKLQVRKVLSADSVFRHSGLKQKSETVWRLDQHELQAAQSSKKASISPHPAAQVLAGLGATPGAQPAYGMAAAATAGAGASLADASQLEQLQAAMGQLNAGAAFAAAGGLLGAGAVPAAVSAEMAQEMALVQQQIAATIAAGPVVVAPEEVQEQLAAVRAPGSPSQLVQSGSTDQLADRQGAAADAAAGAHAQFPGALCTAAVLDPALAAAIAVGPLPSHAVSRPSLPGQALPGLPLPGQLLPGLPLTGDPRPAAGPPPLPDAAEAAASELALPLLEPLEVEVPAALADVAGSLGDASIDL